jgi:hypothetical protein
VSIILIHTALPLLCVSLAYPTHGKRLFYVTMHTMYTMYYLFRYSVSYMTYSIHTMSCIISLFCVLLYVLFRDSISYSMSYCVSYLFLIPYFIPLFLHSFISSISTSITYIHTHTHTHTHIHTHTHTHTHTHIRTHTHTHRIGIPLEIIRSRNQSITPFVIGMYVCHMYHNNRHNYTAYTH